MKHFALAGNPNCGKTTLYNALTGSNAHVGNWPGVTVEKREGDYKKLDELISIVDLPGIYSLSPYTPEEVISRRFIVDDKPDCVINIIDATNLERNLYLTTQILEMDVPVVIALNMMDVVKKEGDTIDVEGLSKAIGVPVIPISAQKGENLDELMEAAYKASLTPREGFTVLSETKINDFIKEITRCMEDEGVPSPLYHAIKFIEGDFIESSHSDKITSIVNDYKKTFNDETFGSDLEALIADGRYNYIVKHYSCHKTKAVTDIKAENKSYKIDKVLTHKWAGIPIFLVILFLIFHFTFSENLFYLGGLFSDVSPSFEGSIFEGLFWTDGGINSPGVILQSFVINITDWFSGVVAGWLSSAPGWVSGLIVDGILAGVFAVLSFVPQILLLFLFFSILEDTGYMARIAFILDRMFRKFGLSGRAFLPMIMGFGCSVPAMINTRTLADEQERIATIRVIPFFSCGAKLPILTAIAAGIWELFGFASVDIITYSMYVVGIVTAIVTIILMKKTVMRGKSSPFIMELPTYHMPQAKSLMIHLWDKLKGYVKKAFTIILASTIVIWFLQSFTFDWKYIEQANPNDIADAIFDDYKEEHKDLLLEINEEYVEDDEVVVDLATLVTDFNENEDDELTPKYEEVVSDVFTEALIEYEEVVGAEDYVDSGDSILAGFGKVISPIFTPLGFGSQLNENGWVYGVSAITGLIAKENVIATFTVLSQGISTKNVKDVDSYIEVYNMALDEEGLVPAISTAKATGIEGNGFTGWSVLIAFIIFNMTTIPCFAAVATAKGELVDKRKFWNTILFWIGTSFIVSSAAYLMLSAWW
ncbi:MAG: ferrous iron transport protein B, partial [Acholeplasmatales bacterium]|nr:ferrous iron transport protein B [Acholeplasmatales bacterium]